MTLPATVTIAGKVYRIVSKSNAGKGGGGTVVPVRFNLIRQGELEDLLQGELFPVQLVVRRVCHVRQSCR